MVMNYSEVEAKVREATNDDPWGAPSTLMQELAKFTFTYEHYPEVMSMLWKRMFESKKNWRRTYKVYMMSTVPHHAFGVTQFNVHFHMNILYVWHLYGTTPALKQITVPNIN